MVWVIAFVSPDNFSFGNNKNDTTHKSEINVTMAFTQSLTARQKNLNNFKICKIWKGKIF